MACASCAKKAALQNRVIEVKPPQVCLFTEEQLLTKLEQAIANQNYSQVSFIKSALNMYSKDCGMFNLYIL